nr:unnamed protein product [Callosobruchus chinensis]
MRTYFPIFINY